MSKPPSLIVRSLRGDRLMLASGALMGITALAFLIDLIAPVIPDVVLWAPTPIGSAILVLVYTRTARTAGSPPVRRFWHHLTLIAALAGSAVTAQSVDVLLHPDVPGQHVGPLMQFFDVACVLTIVYALYRLPLARQTRAEWVRVVLDAGTVMLATAAFMWHFQTRYPLTSQGSAGDWAALALATFALVAVFAVVKVVMSNGATVDIRALRLFAVAMIIAAVGPATREYLEQYRPHLFPEMICMPIVYFVAALAGERQRHAAAAPTRGAPAAPRRRPFSLLPYLAVAAVDALLLGIAWTSHDDVQVIIVFAVLLTGLVVLRQVLAFRENGRLLEQLDHGATHDALTQLPNRVLFHKRLQTALTADVDRPVAVALIDLDDFKEVNDTLGHEIGDVLLIAVAQRLAGVLRQEDMVARLGGDEFVVVIDDADPAAADLAAGRMKDALAAPVLADGHELPIRASIGIADGRTGDEASTLLRHADIAMYAAKNIPGTAHLHYSGEMRSSATDSAHLGAELRTAIDRGELFLLYQPIVSLESGRVLGAEALVRWEHPVQGTLAPDAFIPVAERTGLIVPLGRWVMRTAFQQMASWAAEHGGDAPRMLNVNISARDLREPGFVAAVHGLLTEYDLDGERITLEITETMALEPGQSVTTLHELRALGIRVSLDDFGTGHSPLTLLHDVPVDEVKLDRSFTQTDTGGQASIAAAVIHLARALGLHVVAEGVETPEQTERLLALGYVAAQGFHFARPMPAASFSEVITSTIMA
jgi:diguanylate cyclase (GGDEF)-like protein